MLATSSAVASSPPVSISASAVISTSATTSQLEGSSTQAGSIWTSRAPRLPVGTSLIAVIAVPSGNSCERVDLRATVAAEFSSTKAGFQSLFKEIVALTVILTRLTC